jgi:hypothetical protein
MMAKSRRPWRQIIWVVEWFGDPMIAGRIDLNCHATSANRDLKVHSSRVKEVVVVATCVRTCVNVAATSAWVDWKKLLAIRAEVLTAEWAGQVRAAIKRAVILDAADSLVATRAEDILTLSTCRSTVSS